MVSWIHHPPRDHEHHKMGEVMQVNILWLLYICSSHCWHHNPRLVFFAYVLPKILALHPYYEGQSTATPNDLSTG